MPSTVIASLKALEASVQQKPWSLTPVELAPNALSLYQDLAALNFVSLLPRIFVFNCYCLNYIERTFSYYFIRTIVVYTIIGSTWFNHDKTYKETIKPMQRAHDPGHTSTRFGGFSKRYTL